MCGTSVYDTKKSLVSNTVSQPVRELRFISWEKKINQQKDKLKNQAVDVSERQE